MVTFGMLTIRIFGQILGMLEVENQKDKGLPAMGMEMGEWENMIVEKKGIYIGYFKVQDWIRIIDVNSMFCKLGQTLIHLCNGINLDCN